MNSKLVNPIDSVDATPSESTWTIKDVAKVLDLKEKTVRRMLADARKGQGDFPLPDKANGRISWKADVIEAYRIKRSQASSKRKPTNKQRHATTNDDNATVITGSEIGTENDVSSKPCEVTKPSTSDSRIVKSTTIRKPDDGIRILDLDKFRATEVTERRHIEYPATKVGVIEARRPDSQKHIRVRDGKEWQIPVTIIHYKPRLEFWLVVPEIAKLYRAAKEVSDAVLHVAITEFGETFIWPVKAGRDTWSTSDRAAAKMAVNTWVRVVGILEQGRYNTEPAEDDLGTPTWPDFTREELISYAFEDRVVEDLDSPILYKLRGKRMD